MRHFGLVGFPVGHSFSKSYFTQKFQDLGLQDHAYQLFEMEFLDEFASLWMRIPDLVGVNVTVPHKENVLKYLDRLDASAIKVGAANVIKREGKSLVGYNTDYMAFTESLKKWLGNYDGEALVLGTGGSSKAVQAALDELNIPFYLISRTLKNGDYTYDQLHDDPSLIKRFRLIINTTPLGMYPKVQFIPYLPYAHMGTDHFLFDLIYNPEETLFLREGKKQGAKVKNGLEMLELQAEKSWEIWNK